MKKIKYLATIMLFTTLFISCSNDDTDEELQSIIELHELADDSGGTENPPVEPPK